MRLSDELRKQRLGTPATLSLTLSTPYHPPLSFFPSPDRATSSDANMMEMGEITGTIYQGIDDVDIEDDINNAELYGSYHSGTDTPLRKSLSLGSSLYLSHMSVMPKELRAQCLVLKDTRSAIRFSAMLVQHHVASTRTHTYMRTHSHTTTHAATCTLTGISSGLFRKLFDCHWLYQ